MTPRHQLPEKSWFSQSPQSTQHSSHNNQKSGLSLQRRAAIQRAAVDPANASPEVLQLLRESQGAAYVQRLVEQSSNSTPPNSNPNTDLNGFLAQISTSRAKLTIQPKLTVTPAGDQYEQEADAVAAQVVQQINVPSPAPAVQRDHEDDKDKLQMMRDADFVQRQPEEDKDKLQMMRLQRQTGDVMGGLDVDAGVESRIQAARGSGSPITEGSRSKLESAFGADFSGVRVHTDSESDTLNRSVQARAFTTGQDIFFRQGEYNPGSSDGQKLLAHELTHVVQQGQSQKTRDSEPPLARQPKNIHENSDLSTIQRVIELYDPEERTYRETDPTNGVVYGWKDMYFTGRRDPVTFVRAAEIEELREAIENAESTTSGNIEVITNQTIAYSLHNTQYKFAKADGEYTPTYPIILLKRALQAPFLDSPKRGGFALRYPDANGVLYTTKSDEEIKNDFGTIPPQVTIETVTNKIFADIKGTAEKHKIEVSKDIVYIRKDWRENPLNPQQDKSVFTQGKTPEKVTNSYTTTGWMDHKAYLRKKARPKGGQIGVMEGWNALGYAAYCLKQRKVQTLTPKHLEQDWEWLHIRGSQNGGPTEPDNLVAGTTTTNSRMIPYENRINELSLWAKPTNPLSVLYEGFRYPDTNVGKNIKISIAAENGLTDKQNHVLLNKIPKSNPLTLEFDPLDGRIFDKMSSKLAEQVMDELIDARTRETIVPIPQQLSLNVDDQSENNKRKFGTFQQASTQKSKQVVPFKRTKQNDTTLTAFSGQLTQLHNNFQQRGYSLHIDSSVFANLMSQLTFSYHTLDQNIAIEFIYRDTDGQFFMNRATSEGIFTQRISDQSGLPLLQQTSTEENTQQLMQSQMVTIVAFQIREIQPTQPQITEM